MAYDYAGWLSSMVSALNIADPTGQESFAQAFAPRIIEMAELRIWRDPDLDFLITRGTDSSSVTTAGKRIVPMPPSIVILEEVCLISPAAVVGPSDQGAQRIPLLRVTRSFLTAVWPIESQSQAPSTIQDMYYALYSDEDAFESPAESSPALPNALLIGPTVDDAYHLECSGVMRPAPLGPQNTTTFLTTWMPDLFMAASLIAGAGFQQNFGAASDNPQMAVSWEAEFSRLKRGAGVEAMRQKAQGAGWSAFPMPPIANQSRTSLPPPPPQMAPGAAPGPPG